MSLQRPEVFIPVAKAGPDPGSRTLHEDRNHGILEAKPFGGGLGLVEEGCRLRWSPKPSVTCLFSFDSRQLALKALNERLKRVEDQSAWPSMDDEEEEAAAKTDSPPPLGEAATPPGKEAISESRLITLEAAPLL